MRIIFTNKLSKMVAHYENLRDMIFELATWRDPGEESIQYHGQDLRIKFELAAIWPWKTTK